MFSGPINRWWTVGSGAFACIFGIGPIMSFGFGILSTGMGHELGWGRDVLSTYWTAVFLGQGVGFAALGWLISKFGIRVPSTLFAIVCGAAFSLVAILPPIPGLFRILFAFAGIGSAACTAMPYAVAISGQFNERRGLALGIVVAGSGLGAIMSAQVVHALAEGYGWRTAFLSLGLALGGAPAVAQIFFVRTPANVVKDRSDDTSAGAFWSRTASLYWQNRAFWLIVAPILAVSIATFGSLSSLVAHLTDRGVSKDTITTVLSISGTASALGRLPVGYLLDKFFAPTVTAVILSMAAVGLIILVVGHSVPSAFFAAALIGLAIGAEADLLAFLVSRYFRLEDFSRVLGVIWIAWCWSGSIGTVIVSQAFGVTGSYGAAYMLFSLFLAAGAGMVCLLGPYKYPIHREKKAG